MKCERLGLAPIPEQAALTDRKNEEQCRPASGAGPNDAMQHAVSLLKLKNSHHHFED
jgi:hypothetical protein